MNLHDERVNYYTDSNGTIRRTQPKVRKSKKERLRQRWEGKERFIATGRGHRDTESENKVKEYMRNHPGGVTAIELAENVGCSPTRAARLLDNLSIIGEGNKFLVYEDDEFDPPVYYIGQDDQ